ncbi:MAG: hypothetical protein JW870_09255 [Candidatus Delongbacteria bacterium]|nr:hypothetical protein [Candidatus Delongbacteria bacterium]
MIELPNYYTVECALGGHPDKICDQICDSILDQYLFYDKDAKVAIECLGTESYLVIGGEVFSNTTIDVENIANKVFHQIGYSEDLTILNKIKNQPLQLRKAVQMGASGDQGIMYGFACNNIHSNFLPAGVFLINSVAKEIDLLRNETNLYLPDGKIQMTFDQNKIETLLINIQHFENSNLNYLKNFI